VRVVELEPVVSSNLSESTVKTKVPDEGNVEVLETVIVVEVVSVIAAASVVLAQ
jgi:hypothetical protein